MSGEGGRQGGGVCDGFEQVMDQGVEAEFGCGSVESAAGEATEPEVVFGVAERGGFSDMGALGVERVPLGGVANRWAMASIGEACGGWRPPVGRCVFRGF